MWQELVTFCSFGSSYLWRKLFGWDGDGKEKGLMEHVLLHAEVGDARSVLQVIDDYADHGTWFMNIGYKKGQLLDAALAQRNPQIVLELGTYCGYSAVRIASQLKQPACKLLSLEIRPKVAQVATRIIEHAGLASRVEIFLGPLSNRLTELKARLDEVNKTSFDFVFIDHDKNVYLQDYLLLKDNKLIGEGTVIFADNLGFPGSPKFVEYLNSHGRELETVFHQTKLEYVDWVSDTVAISTFRDQAAS